MSWPAINAVLAERGTEGTARLLLLLLAAAADDAGRAWLSVPTLARQANLSEKQARRRLHELAADGHLADLGPHPDPRYRGAIMYRITAMDPLPSAGGGGASGPLPSAGGVPAGDGAGPLPSRGGDPSRGRESIPLETGREKTGDSSQNAASGAGPDSDGTAGTGEGREACSGGEGSGSQRVRGALRRLECVCGSSEVYEQWTQRARATGARNSREAAFILTWMVERARRCREAVKLPHHIDDQIEPARPVLIRFRAQQQEQAHAR